MITDIPFAYDSSGMIIVKNCLDDDVIWNLIHEGARYGIGDGVPCMNPHREYMLFMDLMRDKHIVKVVEKLVRGKASGLQSQFFFCVPGTKGYAKHQDNFFVEAPYGCFVSVWIPLVDTAPKNGGLTVYLGTHLRGKLPTRKLPPSDLTGQDPNAANEETLIPHGYQPSHLVIEAGSLVFLHGNLVHSSFENKSNANRYAVLNTYIRKGAPFRRGIRAQREEVDLGL